MGHFNLHLLHLLPKGWKTQTYLADGAEEARGCSGEGWGRVLCAVQSVFVRSTVRLFQENARSHLTVISV